MLRQILQSSIPSDNIDMDAAVNDAWDQVTRGGARIRDGLMDLVEAEIRTRLADAVANGPPRTPIDSSDTTGMQAPARAPAPAGTQATATRQTPLTPPDPWRDMAGDALTNTQSTEIHTYAQYTLATFRNIERDHTLTATALSHACTRGEHPDDIRSPDWPAILATHTRAGESVRRASLTSLSPTSLEGIRMAVHTTRTHTVAIHAIGDGNFRVYDNESDARRNGIAQTMSPTLINNRYRGAIMAVVASGSPAAAAMSSPIAMNRSAAEKPNTTEKAAATQALDNARIRAARTMHITNPVVVRLHMASLRQLSAVSSHIATDHDRRTLHTIQQAVTNTNKGLYPLIPVRHQRGGEAYGRTMYTDMHNKTNTLLGMEQTLRAALLSPIYDECDLKRSHINHAIGCWQRQGHTVPAIIQRFLASDTSRDALEADIQRELTSAIPDRERDLRRAQHNRDRPEITACETRLKKARSAPKTVYSAMLNARAHTTWLRVAGGSNEAAWETTIPTIKALNKAIRDMREAVLSHPLNATPLAATGHHRGNTTANQHDVSTAMQNLEDAAVSECATVLRELGCVTALTINDSVLFERPRDPRFWTSCPPAASRARATSVSDLIHSRVTALLGYNTCTFNHLPFMVKPGEPRPSMSNAIASNIIKKRIHPRSPTNTTPPPTADAPDRSPPVRRTPTDPTAHPPDPRKTTQPQPTHHSPATHNHLPRPSERPPQTHNPPPNSPYLTFRASAFADDLVAYLANAKQLPIFKLILSIYERGSGARNSWGAKTLGLRIGASHDPRNDPFPTDWDPQLVSFNEDAAIRTLGVFVGAPDQVATGNGTTESLSGSRTASTFGDALECPPPCTGNH